MNIIFPIAEVVAVKTGCDLIAGNLIGINKPKAIAAYSIAGSAAQTVATVWGGYSCNANFIIGSCLQRSHTI